MQGGAIYWSPLPLPPALDQSSLRMLQTSFSTPYRTSTSLNLTPLNSTQLTSLFDPPWPPFWSLLAPQIGPRSAQDRSKSPLEALLFQKRRFSKNVVSPRRNPILRPQDGTQDDPRSTQDGSKTIFKTFFFRPRFYLRFWSVLGPILAPFWLHLGSPLGLKIGPSAVP